MFAPSHHDVRARDARIEVESLRGGQRDAAPAATGIRVRPGPAEGRHRAEQQDVAHRVGVFEVGHGDASRIAPGGRARPARGIDRPHADVVGGERPREAAGPAGARRARAATRGEGAGRDRVATHGSQRDVSGVAPRVAVESRGIEVPGRHRSLEEGFHENVLTRRRDVAHHDRGGDRGRRVRPGVQDDVAARRPNRERAQIDSGRDRGACVRAGLVGRAHSQPATIANDEDTHALARDLVAEDAVRGDAVAGLEIDGRVRAFDLRLEDLERLRPVADVARQHLAEGVPRQRRRRSVRVVDAVRRAALDHDVLRVEEQRASLALRRAEIDRPVPTQQTQARELGEAAVPALHTAPRRELARHHHRLVAPHDDGAAVAHLAGIGAQLAVRVDHRAARRRQVGAPLHVAADADLATARVARRVDGGVEEAHAMAEHVHGAARVFAGRVEHPGHAHHSVAAVELDVAGARETVVVDRERVVIAHGEDGATAGGVQRARLHHAEVAALRRSVDLDEDAPADLREHDLLAGHQGDGPLRRLDPSVVRDVPTQQRHVRGLDVAGIHDVAGEIEAIDARDEVFVGDVAGGGHEAAHFHDGLTVEEDARRIHDVDDAVREQAALDAGRVAHHPVQHARVGARLQEAHDLAGEDVEALVVDDRAVARADQGHAAVAVELDVPGDHVLAGRRGRSRGRPPEREASDQRGRESYGFRMRHESILSTSR